MHKRCRILIVSFSSIIIMIMTLSRNKADLTQIFILILENTKPYKQHISYCYVCFMHSVHYKVLIFQKGSVFFMSFVNLPVHCVVSHQALHLTE